MKTPIVEFEGLPSMDLDSAKGGALADLYHLAFGDRIAAMRLKNGAKIYEKLKGELQTKGLKLNAETLPERFIFKWFEEATQEDSPELQELWAKLMASAAGGNEEALNRRNIDLLSKMQPEDAKALHIMADAYFHLEGKRHPMMDPVQWDYKRLKSILKSHYNFSDDVVIDNLIYAGVLRDIEKPVVDNNKIRNTLSRNLGRGYAFPNLNAALSIERLIEFTSAGLILVTGIDFEPYEVEKAEARPEARPTR